VVKKPIQAIVVDQLKMISDANSKALLVDPKDLDFSNLGEVLEGADLSNLNLSGVNLKNSNLSNALLRGTQFATFQSGKTTNWSTLEGANFTGADLSGAVFEGAKCKGAKFISTKTDFNKPVSFKGVDLTSTDFSHAQLPGALFDERSLKTKMITIDIDVSAPFSGIVADLLKAVVDTNKDEVVRLLVGKKDQKVDANGVVPVLQGQIQHDDTHGPALIVCINHWNKDIFDKLILHEADVNTVNTLLQRPPLYYAAQADSAEAVSSLLATKKITADSVRSLFLDEHSSFIESLVQGDATARLILEAVLDDVTLSLVKTEKNSTVLLVLLMLAKQGASKLFEEIYKKYTVEGNSLLTGSFFKEYALQPLVQAVIKSTDASTVDEVKKQGAVIVQFLLEQGATITESMLSNTTVQEYINHIKVGLFSLIREHASASDVTSKSETMKKFMQYLQQAKGTSAQQSVIENNKDDEYKDPLFIAVEINDFDCALALIESGVNASNSGGPDENGVWLSALERAIYNKELSFVKLLIEKGKVVINASIVPRTSALGQEYKDIVDYLESRTSSTFAKLKKSVKQFIAGCVRTV